MSRYVEKKIDLQRLDELISAYEIAAQIPEVSGAEHLDMLLIRSELENQKQRLTSTQLKRLLAADTFLKQHLREFHTAISQIVDLALWRQDEEAPPSHWWWYLDVLAYAWPHTQAKLQNSPDNPAYYLDGQLQPA